MNVMMVHNTLSNSHAPIYQISFTYLEWQKSYGPHKLRQLYDLGVKCQGQMNVMMVCGTPSNGHAPTYQISLTNIERQTLWPEQNSPILLSFFDLGVNSQGQMNFMMVCDTSSNGRAHTYQISLSILMDNKVIAHTSFANNLTLGSKVKVK